MENLLLAADGNKFDVIHGDLLLTLLLHDNLLFLTLVTAVLAESEVTRGKTNIHTDFSTGAALDLLALRSSVASKIFFGSSTTLFSLFSGVDNQLPFILNWGENNVVGNSSFWDCITQD